MSTNPATIASLPPELLGELFGCFQCSFVFAHLARFALVCRAWREPAQQALFSVLFLGGNSQPIAYLNSPAKQRYRVKSLVLHCLDPVTESELRDVCPDLRSLDLELPFRTSDDGYRWLVGERATGASASRGT